ncbi:hypothetical protein CFP56_032657, partial [Quercus suber]
MADSSPPRSRRTRSPLQSQSTMTKITELDVDSLAHLREAYLARRTALQKFKFFDPFVDDTFALYKPCNHILLEKNTLTFSQ